MPKFGKRSFGNGMEVNAQVVNGKCPYCTTDGIFISIHQTIYRCVTCGSDIEQKVNGKISYIPHGKPIVLDIKSPTHNGKT